MSLPILNSTFFQSFQPSKEFWMKWGSLENWDEKFAPLYEWENILYVGCSNENPHWSSQQQVVFVFCESKALAKYFAQLKSLTKPPKIPNQQQSQPVDASDPFASLQLHTNESESEEPLVLSDESTSVKISIDDPAEELALNTLNETPEKPHLALTPLDGSILTPEISQPTPTQNSAPAAKTAPLKTSTSPANTFLKPVESVAMSQLSDDFSNQIFQKMKTHYKKVMIFKKEGNAVTPWRWDNQFKPAMPSAHPITLGQPSPFRIVHRTLKPYHGYVVTNDINEKFFDEWNHSQIPDHLTLVPIVKEDNIIGMLLGLSDKDINQKASLQLAEKMAAEISKHTQSTPTYLAS